MKAVLSLAADGTIFLRAEMAGCAFIGDGPTIEAAADALRSLVAASYGPGALTATIHIGDK